MTRRLLSVNWINKVLFCLTFILKFFTDVLYVAQGKGGIIVSAKYITMILGIFCSFAVIYIRKEIGKEIIFRKEYHKLLFVILIFGVTSFLRVLLSGNFTTQTIADLVYMLLAAMYSYGILNSFYFDDILACMKILLVFAIVGYVLEIGTGNFTLSNILASSFYDSYSPFESSYSASISMTLCTFFAYYRKEKKWTIAAFLFCLLTFKRMNILFSFFFLLYPLIFDPNKTVDKRLIRALTVIFTLGTVVLYYLYQPQYAMWFESTFGISATKFSMGRNQMLHSILINGFNSYGYGSTTDFLGRSIEMDFVKIYLELGIIVLFIFIWNYYSIVSTNAFCFWIMTENMLNFLTSHSLSSAFNWGLRFIMIGCIMYLEKATYTRTGVPFFKKIRYKASE